MRFWFCLAALAPVMALSQLIELDGKGQFPEFRTLSGLPGGGFGVKSDGQPSISGAFALSTPVAYSLGPRHMSFGIGSASNNNRIKILAPKQVGTDGTAWAMLGMGTERLGHLTVGGTLINGINDSVMNLHYTPPVHAGNLTFGLGVQDVFSSGGSSGEGIDTGPEGRGKSNSMYAVATYDFGNGVYASVGDGSQRFRHPFVNFSLNPIRGFKAFTEHDGFNWNYGIATELGPLAAAHGDRDYAINVTTSLSMVRGKYLTWGVNVAF